MLSQESKIAELSEAGVTSCAVNGREFRRINQSLLETFFWPTKLATGKWVQGGYRWHAYTFGHQQSLSGNDAVSAYAEQEVTAFFVYYEDADCLFDCTSDSLPDLRPLRNDIYVLPHDMSWLYSLTHECGIGPFFDIRSA